MVALLINISLDIFNLFKKFIHWNISKILIFVWSFILAFLSILPFVLIIFIYGYFVGIDISLLLEQVMSKELGSSIIINLLLYVITITFFVIYFYQYVLFIKLNFKYIDGKELKYLKNNYFKLKKIKKYIMITFLNFIILLIPILSFILLIFILVMFQGGIDNLANTLLNSGNNIFSVISLIGFIASVFGFVYLFYRVCFSYFILVEDGASSFCIDYIRESFKITKGYKRFFKFLGIILVFLLISMPSNFLLNQSEESVYNINNFLVYQSFDDENKAKTLENNTVYIQSLLLEYSKYSGEELNSNIRKNDIYIILLNIFNFLFLYGLIPMVFASFYKRELLLKEPKVITNKIEKHEEKSREDKIGKEKHKKRHKEKNSIDKGEKKKHSNKK